MTAISTDCWRKPKRRSGKNSSRQEASDGCHFPLKKSAIASFKRVCTDAAKVIDLQLYYVENGVEFTDTYGDINESFYNSMGSMYRTVVDALNKTDDPAVYEQFKDRLKAVIEDTAGMGWGFNEDLSDSYYSLKWIG